MFKILPDAPFSGDDSFSFRNVACDQCGKNHDYRRSELVRVEAQAPPKPPIINGPPRVIIHAPGEMSRQELADLLRGITGLMEAAWAEREALNEILSESNVDGWQDRLKKKMANPELRSRAAKAIAHVREQLAQEAKAALI